MDFSTFTDDELRRIRNWHFADQATRDQAEVELAKRNHQRHLQAYTSMQGLPIAAIAAPVGNGKSKTFEAMLRVLSGQSTNECKCCSRHLFAFGHEKGCSHAK